VAPKLLSLHEQFDTSTPAGEFTLRMMVGIARMESRNIADEAAVVREAAGRLLTGDAPPYPRQPPPGRAARPLMPRAHGDR
jgi:DNA invertase Pin-like site-specific DNA recombinase